MSVMIRMICPVCGVHYALEQRFYDYRNNGAADHKTGEKLEWYCPNGHSLIFTESEADKMRRERDQYKQRVAYLNDQLLSERNLVKSAKGQITKLQKRAKAGTCPCCHRTFSNMARHMKTQHPDFNPDNVVPLDQSKRSS